jgi:hypothetical protein
MMSTTTNNPIISKDTNPSNTNGEPTNEFMRQLEKKGEQQVKQLLATPGSVTQDSILDIMREGGKEFVQKTGRNMTYSEMRQLYG